MSNPGGGSEHAAAAVAPPDPTAVSLQPSRVSIHGYNSSLSVPSQISEPSVDEEASWENDSAIDGMSIPSSTTSLRSSIYEHIEENGRTYHRYKEGKYPLPNDLQEQERLDLQHALFCITFGNRLHLAKLPEDFNGRVLDIATGTGIWAIEFANLFPKAEVTGTDLSAIQPTYVPPNCSFVIDDAEDPWIFSKKFDYIHGRALLSCFKDPREVLKSAYDNLNPGGILELQDGIFPLRYIGEAPVDSNLYKWSEAVTAGAAKSGRPWNNAQYYRQWMEELGFEDVVEKFYYWPTSAWAKGRYFKEVSMYFQADLLQGLEAISLKVMSVMGWKPDDIREFIVKVREDLKNKDIHAYVLITVVYGRKPATATE